MGHTKLPRYRYKSRRGAFASRALQNMFALKAFLLLAISTLAVQAAPLPQDANPPVFTATREYLTLTDVPPYFVTLTTLITWTQSPSTTIANPTGTGLPHAH
ncbi:hypothetical protein MIND_00620500 [Mycena indigotica]|uniref:Uncharacterized protein n=1 Tax=Mycena indigotica TaxID=2126181 RepID=A0A8H6W6Y8_9AGAR|nr:uncharacterized protein MIND_00620500 [Mycena indigotica]KAF7303903.1 hypothetical protein MIND_00620500 [Mycena indigotica]